MRRSQHACAGRARSVTAPLMSGESDQTTAEVRCGGGALAPTTPALRMVGTETRGGRLDRLERAV